MHAAFGAHRADTILDAMPTWLTIELAVLTIVLPSFGFLIHWRVDSARRFAVIETNAANLKAVFDKHEIDDKTRNDTVCGRLTDIGDRITEQSRECNAILTDIRERLASLEAMGNGVRDV